jgi:hypothetical protein
LSPRGINSLSKSFHFLARLKIKDARNKTRKITNSTCAIPIAVPATPPNPKKPATKAMIRNMIVQYNISFLSCWFMSFAQNELLQNSCQWGFLTKHGGLKVSGTSGSEKHVQNARPDARLLANRNSMQMKFEAPVGTLAILEKSARPYNNGRMVGDEGFEPTTVSV